METERNIEAWNQQVKNGGYYYLTKESEARKQIEEQITQKIKEILPYTSFTGKKILDAGCGTGEYSQEIAEYAKEVLGFDAAEEAIKKAQESYKKENLTFQKLNVYQLPFEKNTFDIVISRAILHHLYEPKKAIQELARVGKMLLIIETNGINPYRQIASRFSKEYKTVEEGIIYKSFLRKALKKEGYTILKDTYCTFVPPITPNSALPTMVKIEKYIEKTALKKIICGTYIVLATKENINP